MTSLRRTSAALAALWLAVAGCAAAPSAPPAGAGPQVLRLSTYLGADAVGPAGPPGAGQGWGRDGALEPQELRGAQCMARNDRGTWTFATPGAVEVLRSAAPLQVACRLDGYGDVSVELPCVTPRAEAGRIANVAFQAALFSGPFGLILAPTIVIVSATSGPAAFLGVDEVREPDVCAYGAGRDVRLSLQRSR